jgi:Na+/melibiose symporter-like transporter
MDIASLAIGVVAAVLGFIPCCGWMALGPAIVGLILGILDFNRKREAEAQTTVAIVGIALNGLAILVILGYYLLFTAGDIASGLM